MNKFTELFHFDPQKVLFLGVERECYLADEDGIIFPGAPAIIAKLNDSYHFGWEALACQLEERAGPCADIHDLEIALKENDRILKGAEKDLGFKRLHQEFIHPDFPIPLNLYPDPTKRIQRIMRNGPNESFVIAGSRICGTHIHVGMPDPETAIKVHNKLLPHVASLCEMGNGSYGDRLTVLRVWDGENWMPRYYENWEELYNHLKERGCHIDPKRFGGAIRISIHGTIEFRMFGATDSISRIIGWAWRCHYLCMRSLKHI